MIVGIKTDTNRSFAKFLQCKGGSNTVSAYWAQFASESGAEITPEIQRLINEYMGYGNLFVALLRFLLQSSVNLEEESN